MPEHDFYLSTGALSFGISSTEPRTDGIATAPWADVAQVVKEPLCSVFVKSPVSSNSEVGTSPWSYGYGRKVVRGVEFKIGRPFFTPVRRELLPIHSFVPLSKLPILVGIEKLGTK